MPEQARAITKMTVAEFIEKRALTVKPNTIAKDIDVLRHSLNLVVEWELLNENPALGARLPKLPPGRTRFLTPDELRTALEAAPEWLRAPMAFAACTGVRRGEMLSLKWADVNLEQRRLYLRNTKNGAVRILPLSDAALQVLGTLPNGLADGLVFAGVKELSHSITTTQIFRKVGIKDASFHTLRHTAASWLVQQGVDLYAVGKLLGHKSARMTERYAHLSPDYMALAVGKLNGIMSGMLPAPVPAGPQTK